MFVNPEDQDVDLPFQLFTLLCFNENEADVETKS